VSKDDPRYAIKSEGFALVAARGQGDE
jgi:hypothetical protein